jgi:hypothetical protein
MIAFGCAITDNEIYRRCAEPGIRRAAEPDSLILANSSAGSLFRNYNLILDQVRDREDLEALVLVHQDAEIVDEDLAVILRRAFSDPDVAIVGCVGAVGVRTIAWWDGSVTWAGFTHRYREFGGGEVPGVTWDPDDIPPYAKTGEVDSLDGYVLALSPWAVRELRFDESLGLMHGYDLDICLQARAAGKKVITEDFRVIHHHSLELIGHVETWIEAHIRVAEKWDGKMPGVASAPGDWRERARRAEAEAGAAHMLAQQHEIIGHARSRHMERELEEMKSSTSWRLTEPFRRLGRALKRRGD